jgi:predicted Fe-Mo cluster-binding NifX family protein
MKIAVSAGGGSLDSPFEPRFGRVPGFVLYDSDSGEVTHLDNTANMNLDQGAGIKTAQSIAGHGAEVLITGKVGPKAVRALERKNIRIVQGSGSTVREALNRYDAGLLGAASPGAGSGQGGTTGSGAPGGGRGMGGGGHGRGPSGGGQGRGGGARGRGPANGGRGMGSGRRRKGV